MLSMSFIKFIRRIDKKKVVCWRIIMCSVKAFRYIQWIFNVVEKSVFNTDS